MSDVLQSLVAQHCEVGHVTAPNGVEIYVKPAPAADYRRFVVEITKEGADKEQAMRALALACVVHPEPAKANEVFERYPALPAKLVKTINQMAGADVATDVKKG